MPKSKALKVKEAKFRQLRGNIVDLCRNILDLQDFYQENFDDQLEDSVYQEENSKLQAELETEINEFFQLPLPDSYFEKPFSGYFQMSDFKVLLSRKEKLLDFEKKLFQSL